MNGGIDPVYHAVACGAAGWLLLLWLGARWRPSRRVRLWRAACGLATVALLFVPLGGLSLWNWLFSFCPNPSVPLLGLIVVALWSRLGGVAWFRPADWRAATGFGAVAGSALYLNSLLFPFADLYYWGWHHEIAVWALAGVALPALAWGNRAGVLMLASLMAYELETLESHNAWDYLVDPFYWLLSVGGVAMNGLARLRAAWGGRVGARTPLPALGGERS